MSYQLHPDVMARLPPGIPDRRLLSELNIPADVAAWLAASLASIQAAGDSSYIPAGTVMVHDLIPCTADEIDAAIAAL